MAISAFFNPGPQILSTFGDAGDNNVTFSRDAAGKILVNGGAVAVAGGTPTVANTASIQTFGQAGNDTISLSETNGALPAALLFGGAGNDTVTGGSGKDQLFGQAGDDTLLGKGGADFLFGGDGNDTLIGGTGDDQVFGEAGDDRMIWNPGEGTDLFEGGAGTDTAEVNGGNGAETFTITANGARVRFDRVSPAPFSLDIGTTEKLVLNANGGDDIITAGNGLAALVQLTIDGGTGNDTITGGDGADVLIGGDGNDLITGGRGNDTALLGAGDDTFVWNPGDGSDVVEGQGGTDTLLFRGANINEKMDLSANGSRARFTRDVANITMDLNDVERVDIIALGGADTITIGDMSGTDVKQVNIDLASAAGSGTGDGAADSVIVNGTAGNSNINVNGAAGAVTVSGLPAQVSIRGVEGANDSLVINALGGNDTISASTLVDGVIRLTVDGGAGNDTIIGSRGVDTLLGGDGNDVVTGGAGNDVALLGAGDDTFIWAPGDGSDIVEGQAGTDTLRFDGSNVSEKIDISANGSRARLFRDVANITMDLNAVEVIELAAAGGADAISVSDLSGTSVQQVAIDLAASGSNNGDGAADQVTVNATQGDDAGIKLTRAGDAITVNGLAAQVTIKHAEAIDTLTVNGLGGNDTIDVSAIPAGQVALVLNGGDGNDLLIGSAGNDLINGGRGNDVALLGGGDDTFVWNPGDGSDTIEGQGGNDTMLFNGANVSERIDIAANGGRVRFTRDVANITMDLNDVETVDFHALGGVDNITINDLSGTDVKTVKVDLGGADTQPDTIIINATNGDDVISIANTNGVVTISGLAATTQIRNFEAGDRIVINGLGGGDVIEATGLGTAMLFTANGGDGDDVLIGSDGADTLSGGAGDDVLLGGGGLDVLDGGPGDNIVIQDLSSGPRPLTAQGASEGTAGSDVITVVGTGGQLTVNGVAVPAPVATSKAPLTIHGLGGDDVITAAGLSKPPMRFVFDGGDGNDRLHGSQGDDTLIGGAGSDRFSFSGINGVDTIADFTHGTDHIRITGYGSALANFNDLNDHITQVGSDLHVDLSARSAGAGTIVLQNTLMSTITATDFTFS